METTIQFQEVTIDGITKLVPRGWRLVRAGECIQPGDVVAFSTTRQLRPHASLLEEEFSAWRHWAHEREELVAEADDLRLIRRDAADAENIAKRPAPPAPPVAQCGCGNHLVTLGRDANNRDVYQQHNAWVDENTALELDAKDYATTRARGVGVSARVESVPPVDEQFGEVFEK